VIETKDKVSKKPGIRAGLFGAILLAVLGAATAQAQAPAKSPEVGKASEAPHSLELTRAVRPWEFLPALGTRAGLLGNEAGRMEAWVYPLKIFRDFHLKLHVDGKTLAADSLARTLITRPESSTIVYGRYILGARDIVCAG